MEILPLLSKDIGGGMDTPALQINKQCSLAIIARFLSTTDPENWGLCILTLYQGTNNKTFSKSKHANAKIQVTCMVCLSKERKY